MITLWSESVFSFGLTKFPEAPLIRMGHHNDGRRESLTPLTPLALKPGTTIPNSLPVFSSTFTLHLSGGQPVRWPRGVCVCVQSAVLVGSYISVWPTKHATVYWFHHVVATIA